MPRINISAPKSSGERWKLSFVFLQQHHLCSRALWQVYFYAFAIVFVSVCAYEENGGNQMDASEEHLSTNELRGKMEMSFVFLHRHHT